MSMRIRTIKPQFWLSEQVSELTHRQRLLFIGLLMLADKNGCLKCSVKQIRAQIFPFDDVTFADVQEDLCSAAEALLIHFYSTAEDGGTKDVIEFQDVEYIFIPTFIKHQKRTSWEKNDSVTEIPLPKHFISTAEELRQLYPPEERGVKSEDRRKKSEDGNAPPQILKTFGNISENIQTYLNYFRSVNEHCEKTGEMSFTAAIRVQSAWDAPAAVMDEALGAFMRQCCDIVSFKPQTPVGKFENYLKRALEDYKKNAVGSGEQGTVKRLKLGF